MLEELGIPIVTTQGRFGGYQVVPGFKLPPMIFSDEVALALAVGLMAARGLGLAHSMPALATARAKLERVFPAKLKSRLRAVDESVAVEFTRSATVIDQQVLGLLCGAMQERRRVRMTYQSRGDERTEREFDPYGLVYRAGRWYIIGWCHLRRGLRSFRLDRVVSVGALAVPFDRPEKFDALTYLKESITHIPRAHTVEVLLETDLATAQKSLGAYVGVIECVEGGVLLRAQADDLDWIARELARLPFDFRVKAPQSLRAAVCGIARRLERLAAG
jgi:predicted DNA-binding transcriptional regulator YafY